MNFLKLLSMGADFIGEHPVEATQAMVCGFVAQFLVAHTLGGHHDRLAERAERWKRGGEPMPGFGSFFGRVLSLRDPAADRPVSRAGADGVAVTGRREPVVERVRTQRLARQDGWRDIGVSERADTFRLELASGHELEVVPGKPGLSGFEKTVSTADLLREVRSAVYPDEQVWITGYLEPAPRGTGAYRGGGGAPRKVRAPRGRPLLITREPPAEEWRRLARAHRTSGWVALVSLAIAAGVAYPSVLAPWLAQGPAVLPPLPRVVMAVWMVLAVVTPFLWLKQVQVVRRAWGKPFSWW